MDHFSAAEGEEHYSQHCVVADAIAVTDQDSEPILQQLNGLAIGEQAENGPSQAGRRLDGRRPLS
jgi:hypothetical protein